jgi:hypothetical protein
MKLSVIVVTVSVLWFLTPHWFKQMWIGILHLLTMLYRVRAVVLSSRV